MLNVYNLNVINGGGSVATYSLLNQISVFKNDFWKFLYYTIQCGQKVTFNYSGPIQCFPTFSLQISGKLLTLYFE